MVQRGNNRQPCFFDDDDRHLYLHYLKQSADKCGGSVHAYVLMTNHVHLLATGLEAGAVGRMMQSLGRRFVRYFNKKHGRTGTLWEGRFKSSLIGSDRYLLACYRYIELNPVRGGLVDGPGKYRWSSYRHNAFGKPDRLVSPHATYLSLGSSDETRQLAYRQLFQYALDDSDTQAIRDHINQGRVLGSE